MNPATAVLIFAITGVGGVITYVTFRKATRVGPKLELSDLRPLAPWEGPPVPKFMKTRPELMKELTEV